MTKRETILVALADGLAALDMVTSRTRLAPMALTEGPTANLLPEAEAVEWTSTDAARHTLEILVRVTVPGNDQDADPYVDAAHGAIMAAASAEPAVLWIQDTATNWNVEQGETQVMAVELRYAITYETAPGALN